MQEYPGAAPCTRELSLSEQTPSGLSSCRQHHMYHSAFDCMPAEVLFIHQLLAEQRISNSLQLRYEELPLEQGESRKRAVCIFEKVTAGFLKAPLASSLDSAGLD